MPLLERDAELEAVRALLAAASAGRGGVLLVEGPPGIGKTALLDAAADLGAAQGGTVARAAGGALERAFPFGLARQLFERRLAAAGPAERAALLRGAAAGAAPALGLTGPPPAAAPAVDDGLRATHGLYWLAAGLAGGTPLVLCVDDLHWADRASLRWLVYLARRLDGLRLAVVAAARPAEPGADQDLLDALAVERATTVLRPAPLATPAVATLIARALGDAPDPAFLGACHDATGGNPLLVRDLLTELAAGGVAPTAGAAQDVLGGGLDGLARTVRHRLAGLGAPAAALARAVAVLGEAATIARAAALAGVDEQDAGRAVDDLAARDVLARPHGGAPLAFRHPVVRAAVAYDLAPAEASGLHRGAAERLQADGADATRVAVHLLHVEPGGDPWVLDVLQAAGGEAAARGAPEAAARFLARALLEAPGTGDRRAEVLLALGAAEAAAGDRAYAGHLEEALRQAADDGLAARVALTLARALAATTGIDRALEVVEQALARVGPAHPAAAELEAELLALAQLDVAHPERLAAHALPRVAQVHRGEPVPAPLLAALAGFLVSHYPPASLAVAAADAALAAGWQPGAVDSAVTATHAQVYVCTGELDRAAEVHALAADGARRRGSVLALAIMGALRAEAALARGRAAEAEGEAQQALDLGGSELGPMLGAWIAAVLVGVLVVRARLDDAEQALARVAAPEAADRTFGTELLLVHRAALRQAQGRTAEAIDDLRAAGTVLGDAFTNPGQNRWRGRLARVLAAAGERDEARALAAEELFHARRFGAPVPIGVALTAAGAAEPGAAGVALLDEAVATLAPTAGRLAHADALVELGAAQRRTGARAVARDTLRAGLDLAARCGATALADRAHDELVTAGGRVRRGRRFLTGPESLTAGEHRVAALAAEGLTNRQIAERLFVTQAAVQWHLRHAFRKLDISSRTQLAAALAAPAAEPSQGAESDLAGAGA